MRINKTALWRRIAVAVITAAVLSGAGTTCFAADTWLTATFEKNGQQAEIVARSVPDDIYAAQVTIPVSQYQGTFSVTPADNSSVCEIRQSDGNLVIYLDNSNAISKNGSIAFGTISADGSFSVGDKAELLLADKLLQGSIFTVKVDVSKESSSSSSSGDSGGGTSAVSSDTTVKPTIEGTVHGSVKVSADGNSITIQADQGYKIADVLVNGKSVGAVSSYLFDKDDKIRKVMVIFEQETDTKAAATSFSDVPAAHWAKGAIDYVVSRQLFFGTDTDKFSPDNNMTRAMFVTVLSRFAAVLGETWELPSSPTASFRDVPADAWYAAAVSWSKGANLVGGIEEGIFAPDAPVTREQIAVLLVRYADLCGIALPQKEQPMSFTDGGTISPYAQDAVRKAQIAGILHGREQGNFAPQDYATRAEVAAMLERFIKAVS